MSSATAAAEAGVEASPSGSALLQANAKTSIAARMIDDLARRTIVSPLPSLSPKDCSDADIIVYGATGWPTHLAPFLLLAARP